MRVDPAPAVLQTFHAVVTVTRGGRVESRHVVVGCLTGADSSDSRSEGSVECFARSTLKPLQALVLVESGADARFGLGDAEVAVAAGSHAGCRLHADTVARMLARGAFTPADLDCGSQRPFSGAACDDLARRGAVCGQLENNCSGKHAGFLLAARHLGFDPTGYRHPGHPLQRLVTATVGEVCGLSLTGREALDGCGVPTFFLPLGDLARGFARLGSGWGMPPARAAAARRIRAAIASCAECYGGSDRLDTRVASVCGEAVLLKTGAEGVVAAAIPAAGLGIAVKASDGAGRAAEALMARLLLDHMPAPSPAAAALLTEIAAPTLRNRHGEPVGHIEVTITDWAATPAGDGHRRFDSA